MTDSDIKKISFRSRDSFLEFKDLIKHTARCLLWLPVAKSLKQQKGDYLRYFTLPGKFAWDIFLFEKNNLLKKEARGFPDVRFCDNNAQFYTEATRLLGSTIGIKKNFEELVIEDNKIFWEGFPYDLYNLDFCGTSFPDNQPPFSDTFKAIKKIIYKHAESSAFPFVIFLTIKAKKEETRSEAISELKGNIESNRANPIFNEAITRLIPDINTFVEDKFCDFMIVSIPKLICHLAKDHCNVEIKARSKYKRSNYFITKFVFLFTPKIQSLVIDNPNYNYNVTEIMRSDNIKEIKSIDITEDIKASHKELKDYIKLLRKS